MTQPGPPAGSRASGSYERERIRRSQGRRIGLDRHRLDVRLRRPGRVDRHQRARLAPGAGDVLRRGDVRQGAAGRAGRLPAQHQDVPDRRAADPARRAAGRAGAQHQCARVLPAPGAGHGSTPTSSAACRRSWSSTWSASGCPRSASRASRPTWRRWASSRSPCRTARTWRRCSAPGIESIHPSQVAAARSLGLSHGKTHAVRGAAAGHPPGGPAAAERLHLAAEGHRAGGHHRAAGGAAAGADPRRQHLQLHALPGRRRCCSSC